VIILGNLYGGLNGRKIIQIRNGEAFCSNNNRHVRKCVNASSARVTSLTFFSGGKGGDYLGNNDKNVNLNKEKGG
jgi:hypothetical protein